MARISQRTIDLIKDTADIVDVVSEFVPLQAAGKNMKGLCPFHSEKTPSFFVSKERQIFNCFGCGKKGNAIVFIQEYKNYSFMEALKFLADKYNIELELDDNQLPERSNENLFKANEKALEFFSLNLLNIESGKPAADYLLSRGLTFETIEEFELGFSPNKNTALLDHLKKDFQALDLMNAGLVNRNQDGNFYDLFRSRIMFPIRDERNKVIAFSGRVFGDSSNPAKYVNTPYTEIFSKGQTLYNLYHALPYARQSKRIVLMEGYMDVIKASMAGIKEAVCSMGTQLTIDQALIIKKHTDDVIICYDGDDPGREAAYKAIKILEKAKLNVKVVVLPNNMDPDEYITKHDDFIDYLENNQLDQYEFVYRMIIENKNLSVPSDIEVAKNKLFDFFGKTSGMIREIYLKRFALETGGNYNTVLADYHQSRIDEKIMIDQKVKLTRIHHQKIEKPRYLVAEKTVLNYYLQSTDFRDMIDAKFNLCLFQNIDIRAWMTTARDVLKQNPNHPLVVLKSGLSDSSKEKLDHIIFKDYTYSIEELDSCIKILQVAKLEEEIEFQKEKIESLKTNGKTNESLAISKEILDKQKKIKELEGRSNGQKTNYR